MIKPGLWKINRPFIWNEPPPFWNQPRIFWNQQKRNQWIHETHSRVNKHRQGGWEEAWDNWCLGVCLKGVKKRWYEMNQMRHDTTGDTSVSEGRRVGSGRSRRGCFGGRRMGQNMTDPDSKTGSIGRVGTCNLQWFFDVGNESRRRGGKPAERLDRESHHCIWYQAYSVFWQWCYW